jgi:hypothetical protein
MQLVNHQDEDVQFTDGAKTVGHLAQTTAEFASTVWLDLEHGQQFAQPARGNPRSMQRGGVAPFDAWKHPSQPIEPFA